MIKAPFISGIYRVIFKQDPRALFVPERPVISPVSV